MIKAEWTKADALDLQPTCDQLATDAISRQAVRFIESDSDAYPQEWNDDYEKGFTDALNKVLALPSAQMEVIRCKDCMCWDKSWANDWGKDYHYCIMVDSVRKGDFYCADAERRTDGN